MLLCGLVFFTVGAWRYDLWPADEPRFGQIAREILQTGDWIVLRVNGSPYYEKPPLLFWLIALVSKPFGDVFAITARIPSIIAALAVLALTYKLAAGMYGRRIGLWSGLLLITSVRFWWQARSCQTDMLLTAFMTLSLFSLWQFISTKRWNWLIMFYGGIVGGLYTKGPPALVFPGLCVLAFFWKNRDERRQLHLPLGLILSIALVLVWLIPARMRATNGQEAVTEQIVIWDLFVQTVGRFVFGISKAQGPWYFFINLPIDWLPWALFLPFIIPWAWRHRREDVRMRFLLAWIVPAFIFFSISIGKRQIYLLPIFPALSILMARGTIEAVASGQVRLLRGISIAWAGLLSALALVLLVTRFVSFGHDLDLGFFRYIFIVALGLCIADSLYHVSAKRLVKLPVVITRTTLLVYFCLALVVLPALNPFKSARYFCEPLRKLSESGIEYRLYSVGFSREEYIYHSKHFHEPVFTELLAVEYGGDMSLLQQAKKQKYLRDQMIKAVMEVQVGTVDAIKDDEIDRLRSALYTKIEQNDRVEVDFVKRFEEALAREVSSFAATFWENTPAFMFIQEFDWRWLVAFEPAFRECIVLRHQSVGRRDVLLVANAAGAALVASHEATD